MSPNVAAAMLHSVSTLAALQTDVALLLSSKSSEYSGLRGGDAANSASDKSWKSVG